ncbi:MAG: aminodeoxychorismate/anthranilate synthase component II [Gammaproteobacteria bacterium]|nr:aminodeoxychorismate/anthranilate synthase component II [Gammaproteobacteria bacterium]
MILLIDNYDSFVYNLARYVGQLGYKRKVVRNDEITLNGIEKINPSHIIISPGPRAPDDAGISLEVIHQFFERVPILGICLGHQAIGQAFGGSVERAIKPMHGKSSYITHNKRTIFKDIVSPLKVARYHSLIVEKNSLLSSPLEIIAESEEGEVMGLQHKKYNVVGVQFHPESVLTDSGYKILSNFLEL